MCLAIPFGWKVSGACKIHLRFRSCDSVSEKSSGQRPTILEHQGFETQTNFRSEILRTRANSKLCKNAVVGQAWFSTWVEWRASSYRHEPLSAARWREAGGEREEHLDCRRLTQPMRTERGRFRSGSAGFQNRKQLNRLRSCVERSYQPPLGSRPVFNNLHGKSHPLRLNPLYVYFVFSKWE